MTIRLKLAVYIALTGASTVAAASGVFLTLQRRVLRASAEDKVHILLNNVRAMAEEAGLGQDPLILVDYLNYLKRDRAEVVSARARFGARWVGPEPGPTQREVLRVERVLVPGGGGRPDMLVELGLSRRVLDERLAAAQHTTIRELLQAAALVVLIGIGFSFWLSSLLTYRIIEVERAMEDVGAGRLDCTVLARGNDEISRLARGFNAMTARLKEVDEMKKAFVASVTHELRSPLSAIKSYVGALLRESNALGEDERRSLERIEANASRLEHFVTSLLDLARIERGQLDFRARMADFVRIVEDAAEFQRARAAESGLSLEVCADLDLPRLRLDPDMITQVVSNLVSNAIKFTPPGGAIAVSVRRLGDGVECAVTDGGVGIPAAALARLFRPFERGADPLRAGGTGLGLSIVKAIIERHGGQVTVDSKPGRGSRFAFTLPVAAEMS